MNPMLHTDDYRAGNRRRDPRGIPDRPNTTLGTTIALIIIAAALIASAILLVRAGTDGIDAGPSTPTVVQETP